MRRLNYTLWSVLVLFIAIGTSSCDSQESNESNPIPDEILGKVADLGYDIYDVKLVPKQIGINKFSDTETELLVEGDIRISMEQLEAMVASDVLEVEGEQYYTNNLVSSPRTISVIGYTGSGNALTSTMRTGLQWAINNYNRENIGLTFSLSFAASTNADIVVYNNNRSGGGGSAGFPSGGNPYKWVQINAGTSSLGNNANEHVIGHEIGHCIGFRHTDFTDRRSCSPSSQGNEGTAEVGANHIPGTGTTRDQPGFDNNSLMLACFSRNTDGEFSSQDITALEFLY